jgi:ribosomal protein L12E/L44/L45/RPP1/RPP2
VTALNHAVMQGVSAAAAAAASAGDAGSEAEHDRRRYVMSLYLLHDCRAWFRVRWFVTGLNRAVMKGVSAAAAAAAASAGDAGLEAEHDRCRYVVPWRMHIFLVG